MIYTAPDGFILESKPHPKEVTYTCDCSGIADGIYESTETTSAATAIGIKQIKIKRVVNDNRMTITIKESSDSELTEYIQTNK
jgi:hypothetical protein